MKSFVMRMLILASTLACGSAGAAVFSYTGNTMDFGGHVTATADVSYAGAGSYVFGSGLNSYALSAYDSSNNLLFTNSTADAGYNNLGYVNYMTFNGSGNITNWFLYAYNNNNGNRIITIGNDVTTPSNCLCGTDDYYSIGISGVEDFTAGNSGTWSVPVPVPEPGSLALLGLGLAGLGFGKRKRQLAA